MSMGCLLLLQYCVEPKGSEFQSMSMTQTLHEAEAAIKLYKSRRTCHPDCSHTRAPLQPRSTALIMPTRGTMVTRTAMCNLWQPCCVLCKVSCALLQVGCLRLLAMTTC